MEAASSRARMQFIHKPMALENGRQANTRRKYVRLKLVGRVAQVVEQRPFKAWVAGSNPAALTNLARLAFASRHERISYLPMVAL